MTKVNVKQEILDFNGNPVMWPGISESLVRDVPQIYAMIQRERAGLATDDEKTLIGAAIARMQIDSQARPMTLLDAMKAIGTLSTANGDAKIKMFDLLIKVATAGKDGEVDLASEEIVMLKEEFKNNPGYKMVIAGRARQLLEPAN
jgi:hypothetical protein